MRHSNAKADEAAGAGQTAEMRTVDFLPLSRGSDDEVRYGLVKSHRCIPRSRLKNVLQLREITGTRDCNSS
jgi:hypothetical protein